MLITPKTYKRLLMMFLLNVAQLSHLQGKSATGSHVFSPDKPTLVRSIQKWIKQLTLTLMFI